MASEGIIVQLLQVEITSSLGEADSYNHWQRVYETRNPLELSWYQPSATTSLALIEIARIEPTAPVIDVGAGSSVLVDELVQRGFSDLSLLDIAEEAFGSVRARLAESSALRFIVADITKWQPNRRYALWHDRAVFHFLTEPAQRDAYKRAMRAALATPSHTVIATFALDGPERCSGLPVCRYSAETLATEFKGLLRVVKARREIHRTPSGGIQPFEFILFERDR